jgi:hypothetical protein
MRLSHSTSTSHTVSATLVEGPRGSSRCTPGSDYSSDSNPASGYYSDSSYEFDFVSGPIESESEINTAEEPLSGPATGLVITSSPAGRFVYWPDCKTADLTDSNSRCVAYLDSLPFQEGTPLAPTEVATTDSSLGTPDRQVFMAAGDIGPSEALSGILPGYSCKKGRRRTPLEFPCNPIRTRSV